MRDLIVYCEELIKEAGERLLRQTVAVTKHKTANDLLTENDILTETFLVSSILEKYPNVNIVSEESNADKPLKGISVVIDPIDGTCNYAVGTGRFGIQMAIFEETECVAAYLYFPVPKKLVTAVKGEGAFCNGERLMVNKEQSSKDGMLLISDYYGNIDIPMDKQFDLVKALQPVFLKTRHYGAACVDFGELIYNRALAYVCYYYHLWDIAPGLFIAKECGCVYSFVDGNEYTYGVPGLVVANSQETLDKIVSAYKKL